MRLYQTNDLYESHQFLYLELALCEYVRIIRILREINNSRYAFFMVPLDREPQRKRGVNCKK